MPDETDPVGDSQPDPAYLELQAENSRLQQQLAEQARAAAFSAVLGHEALSSPLGEVFTKGYDGELTPDTIKERATAVGLLTPPPASEPEPSDQQDVRDDLRTGGAGEPVGGMDPVSPYERAAQAGKDAWKNGTEDDALAAHFAVLVDAAARGDERVLVDYFKGRQAVA